MSHIIPLINRLGVSFMPFHSLCFSRSLGLSVCCCLFLLLLANASRIYCLPSYQVPSIELAKLIFFRSRLGVSARKLSYNRPVPMARGPSLRVDRYTLAACFLHVLMLAQCRDLKSRTPRQRVRAVAKNAASIS